MLDEDDYLKVLDREASFQTVSATEVRPNNIESDAHGVSSFSKLVLVVTHSSNPDTNFPCRWI